MFKNHRGFTLLEIVIAIGLSSFLLLTVYMAYFGINRSIDSASEGQDAIETGRLLMELIKQDLRGISPNPKYQLISKIVESMEKEPDQRIDFVTTSYLGVNPMGLSKVGYFIYKTEDNKKIFMRRESKEVKDDVRDGGTSCELSRIVSSFKLSFYNGTDWVDEWDSKSGGKLPKQVKIAITVTDEKGYQRKFVTDESIPGTL
jgi:type II secretion system protein J